MMFRAVIFPRKWSPDREVKNKCRRYQVPMTTPPSTEITVPWIKLA